MKENSSVFVGKLYQKFVWRGKKFIFSYKFPLGRVDDKYNKYSGQECKVIHHYMMSLFAFSELLVLLQKG